MPPVPEPTDWLLPVEALVHRQGVHHFGGRGQALFLEVGCLDAGDRQRRFVARRLMLEPVTSTRWIAVVGLGDRLRACQQQGRRRTLRAEIG
jgi:hypothetical protein